LLVALEHSVPVVVPPPIHAAQRRRRVAVGEQAQGQPASVPSIAGEQGEPRPAEGAETCHLARRESRPVDLAGRAGLERVLALRARIAGLEQEAAAAEREAAEIAADQGRLRENVKAVGDRREARELVAPDGWAAPTLRRPGSRRCARRVGGAYPKNK
jgi:hypothetical protein